MKIRFDLCEDTLMQPYVEFVVTKKKVVYIKVEDLYLLLKLNSQTKNPLFYSLDSFVQFINNECEDVKKVFMKGSSTRLLDLDSVNNIYIGIYEYLKTNPDAILIQLDLVGQLMSFLSDNIENLKETYTINDVKITENKNIYEASSDEAPIKHTILTESSLETILENFRETLILDDFPRVVFHLLGNKESSIHQAVVTSLLFHTEMMIDKKLEPLQAEIKKLKDKIATLA